MRYYLTDKETARRAGFAMAGRVTTRGKVWINEKELMACGALTGTTAEARAAQMGAETYSASEAKYQIRIGNRKKR